VAEIRTEISCNLNIFWTADDVLLVERVPDYIESL